MNTIREAFAFNLKLRRGSKSQAQFAEFLGIPVRTYQKIEAGNVPQKATMKRITQKLGVTEAALVQLPLGSESAQPILSRSAILGEIVSALPALDDDKLRAVLDFARGFAEMGRAGDVQELGNKKRNL